MTPGFIQQRGAQEQIDNPHGDLSRNFFDPSMAFVAGFRVWGLSLGSRV